MICAYCKAEITDHKKRTGKRAFCNRRCRQRFYGKYYKKNKPKKEPVYFNKYYVPKKCRKLTDSCLHCPLKRCREDKVTKKRLQLV